MAFTHRHYIAMTFANQLREHTEEQRELVLDYCEEYIAQYRKENPHSNLPQLKYIFFMALDKLSSPNVH